MPSSASGHARALAALARGGVRCVLVDVGGIDFDATTFEVAGTSVRVGRLEKLLASKEASGRARDRAFLEAFEASRTREGT
jgi:hypothetical protein